jgi:hypothetical protein
MPIQPTQGTMQTPASGSYIGDVIGPGYLGVDGVGNPGDVSAIFSLSGTFVNAVVAIEGLPQGTPMTPALPPSPANPNGLPSTPLSSSQWTPIAEVGVINGQLTTSPVGPLTSSGVVGTGFAYTAPIGAFQQVRMRLLSISSGAVVGGIATVPFPISTGIVQPGNPVSQLELGRIRVGMSILLEGMGINLQDLTQSDIQGFI